LAASLTLGKSGAGPDRDQIRKRLAKQLRDRIAAAMSWLL